MVMCYVLCVSASRPSSLSTVPAARLYGMHRAPAPFPAPTAHPQRASPPSPVSPRVSFCRIGDLMPSTPDPYPSPATQRRHPALSRRQLQPRRPQPGTHPSSHMGLQVQHRYTAPGPNSPPLTPPTHTSTRHSSHMGLPLLQSTTLYWLWYIRHCRAATPSLNPPTHHSAHMD